MLTINGKNVTALSVNNSVYSKFPKQVKLRSGKTYYYNSIGDSYNTQPIKETLLDVLGITKNSYILIGNIPDYNQTVLTSLEMAEFSKNQFSASDLIWGG